MQKNQIEKLFFQPAIHMEFHSVEITPEVAKVLLSNTDSKVQRKLKRNHILSLADDMRAGNFIVVFQCDKCNFSSPELCY